MDCLLIIERKKCTFISSNKINFKNIFDWHDQKKTQKIGMFFPKKEDLIKWILFTVVPH